MRCYSLLTLAILTLPPSQPAHATDQSRPQPLPIERQVPAARDIPYPGVIGLAVDATDVARGIFRVQERIPVPASGKFHLLYPQWLPGNHAPRGPIDDVAGLTISANGRPLDWRRDPVDVYAIQVDVPEGVQAIDLAFDYVSPVSSAQGRVVMTREMLSLQWNLTAFYPAGYFTRRIMVQPSVTLPAGWNFGTALEPLPGKTAGPIGFRPVDFETLVDSPMLAGRYFRQVQLGAKERLNIAADRPEELAATDAQLTAHRRLVEQAGKLFGGKHYDRYEFLLSISDRLGGIGLEHQRSSENGVATGYFTRWDEQTARRNLLPHEYTHSWNGKYRRGADLYTPDYSVPMRNSLLWVYEGQTQFWGYVLQARSGLVSADDTLASLAMIAAALDTRPGRQWRPLIDTTNDPIIAARRPQPWLSLQRSEDYYNEGMLVWLDTDMQLRELTGGRRSLDDFASAFFGARDGDLGILTYDFEDVVNALQAIAPFDWAAFLRERVDRTQSHAPLAGFARGGYRLVFAGEPTSFWRTEERRRKQADFSYSLGIVVDNSDKGIEQVIWDSPAFEAGLTNSDTLVALDGETFDSAELSQRIATAATTRKPIELLVRRGDQYRTVSIAYYGGNRYPRLERTGNAPGWLDQLLQPRK
ncbi:peptidase M61 [Sphingomonas sp. Root710]|uniref:M61 family metallopeptidase n=1 Tax=Sphingomonas sp. Root710 TaxID=1736594 RepID=UPI0006F93018|nr:PDZ domain-containing protein [Sphingomonas sp. Root710]KRB85769.1 peptidase M61 [Sphingomonas sp. Root710]